MTMREILQRLSNLPGFEVRKYDGVETIPHTSTNGLSMLYDGIRSALEADDSKEHPDQREYFVRDTNDWREWATAIEVELDKRNVTFSKIVW